MISSLIHQNYRPSPYRAVNTLRLGYTNQSVNAVYGNNGCLLRDPHKTHKVNTLCRPNVQSVNVELAGHEVTAGP